MYLSLNQQLKKVGCGEMNAHFEQIEYKLNSESEYEYNKVRADFF